MPQSTMNGHTETKVMNGHGSASTGKSIMSGYEMCDGNFLFTSESVGEGHPGKCSHIRRTQFLITIFFLSLIQKEETKKKTDQEHRHHFQNQKKTTASFFVRVPFPLCLRDKTMWCVFEQNTKQQKKKDFK